MVGRQHKQQFFRIVRGTQGCSRRNGRSSVPTDGLKDFHFRRNAYLLEFRCNGKSVLFVAHHHRRQKALAIRNPQGGFLDHGALGGERHELLGMQSPRGRPQPRTGSPGQNDRADRFHWSVVPLLDADGPRMRAARLLARIRPHAAQLRSVPHRHTRCPIADRQKLTHPRVERVTIAQLRTHVRRKFHTTH